MYNSGNRIEKARKNNAKLRDTVNKKLMKTSSNSDIRDIYAKGMTKLPAGYAPMEKKEDN